MNERRETGAQEDKERKTQRREDPGAERRERLNSCRRRISRLRDRRRRTQTRGRRTIAARSLLRPGRACDSASSDVFTSLGCVFCSLRRRRNVSQAVSEARPRERGGRGSMASSSRQDANLRRRGAAGDRFGMSAQRSESAPVVLGSN
jgi:hypothetical protein